MGNEKNTKSLVDLSKLDVQLMEGKNARNQAMLAFFEFDNKKIVKLMKVKKIPGAKKADYLDEVRNTLELQKANGTLAKYSARYVRKYIDPTVKYDFDNIGSNKNEPKKVHTPMSKRTKKILVISSCCLLGAAAIGSGTYFLANYLIHKDDNKLNPINYNQANTIINNYESTIKDNRVKDAGVSAKINNASFAGNIDLKYDLTSEGGGGDEPDKPDLNKEDTLSFSFIDMPIYVSRTDSMGDTVETGSFAEWSFSIDESSYISGIKFLSDHDELEAAFRNDYYNVFFNQEFVKNFNISSSEDEQAHISTLTICFELESNQYYPYDYYLSNPPTLNIQSCIGYNTDNPVHMATFSSYASEDGYTRAINLKLNGFDKEGQAVGMYFSKDQLESNNFVRYFKTTDSYAQYVINKVSDYNGSLYIDGHEYGESDGVSISLVDSDLFGCKVIMLSIDDQSKVKDTIISSENKLFDIVFSIYNQSEASNGSLMLLNDSKLVDASGNELSDEAFACFGNSISLLPADDSGLDLDFGYDDMAAPITKFSEYQDPNTLVEVGPYDDDFQPLSEDCYTYQCSPEGNRLHILFNEHGLEVLHGLMSSYIDEFGLPLKFRINIQAESLENNFKSLKSTKVNSFEPGIEPADPVKDDNNIFFRILSLLFGEKVELQSDNFKFNIANQNTMETLIPHSLLTKISSNQLILNKIKNASMLYIYNYIIGLPVNQFVLDIFDGIEFNEKQDPEDFSFEHKTWENATSEYYTQNDNLILKLKVDDINSFIEELKLRGMNSGIFNRLDFISSDSKFETSITISKIGYISNLSVKLESGELDVSSYDDEPPYDYAKIHGSANIDISLDIDHSFYKQKTLNYQVVEYSSDDILSGKKNPKPIYVSDLYSDLNNPALTKYFNVDWYAYNGNYRMPGKKNSYIYDDPVNKVNIWENTARSAAYTGTDYHVAITPSLDENYKNKYHILSSGYDGNPETKSLCSVSKNSCVRFSVDGLPRLGDQILDSDVAYDSADMTFADPYTEFGYYIKDETGKYNRLNVGGRAQLFIPGSMIEENAQYVVQIAVVEAQNGGK